MQFLYFFEFREKINKSSVLPLPFVAGRDALPPLNHPTDLSLAKLLLHSAPGPAGQEGPPSFLMNQTERENKYK